MNPRRFLPRWGLGVFCLALAARLAFLFVADQPLLYTHQTTYFTNALRIAEHPHALHYVVTSDEWRTWDGHWTIAPLYHLFAALVFRLAGPHLVALRLVQCILDALAATAVAALGRQAGGTKGTWAGVIYALYWPAVEMPTWTMTENLHTALFVVGVALLAREQSQPNRRLAFLGGIVLGLSALTRSVSTGFIALAAVARLRRGDLRGSILAAALICGGGATVIAPWTARNVFIVGDPVLVESAAFENIWWANNFVERERYLRQERTVHSQKTPADKRAAALHFALRGIQRRPDRFVEKVGVNFRHFFRPEGLQNLLVVERSLETWRHLGTLLLDDLPLLVGLPAFGVFVLAGRAGPVRRLVVAWTAYYLFMVIVVFHNEIRYRSAFVPFVFAGAVAGLAATEGRRWRVILGLGLGLFVTGLEIRPYAGPAWRALRATWAARAVPAAVRGGDLSLAHDLTERAAALAPRSPRPFFNLGRALLHAEHAAEAMDAYALGRTRATPANWRALVARPRILEALGRPDEAAYALRDVHALSWNTDPWLVLEAAWSELPPPRADEVQLAGSDYGAVRGFLHPRGVDPRLYLHRLEWNRYEHMPGDDPPAGPHRWSRGQASLRLLPTRPSPSYDVTLTMGVPFPSTLGTAEVAVTGPDRYVRRFRLDRDLRPYVFRVEAVAGQPLVFVLRTRTWSRPGEPADQGVRVDRLGVTPTTSPAP